VGDVASALWHALAAQPGLLVATGVAAASAALLPAARAASPHLVASLGLVLTAGAAFTGAGVAPALVTAAVWLPIAVLALARRS